ncbi:MAG: citrate synthase, partial [Clostridia bacterium]|nr:citrate synthase [Clostridia bacterium]
MLPSDKKDERFIESLCNTLRKDNVIPPEYYDQYNVKRGLRNTDGTGVVAGCTRVCNVHGYLLNEGERISHDGELTYRGYNVEDLIRGFQKADRFGFEDTAFLLLFGHLPSKEELQKFNDLLWEFIELPYGFVEDMIMKAPSPDVMNKLACGVLALYGYDEQAGNTDIENVVMQSISLISRMPSIAVAAYQVKKRYYDKRSLYFHFPKKGQSMAESILYMLRSDKKFTDAEAKLLDLCLILHMEHGGGNNSTFTTRV